MLNYEMANDFKHQKEAINLFFNTKPLIKLPVSPKSGKPVARNNGKDGHKQDNRMVFSNSIETKNH